MPLDATVLAVAAGGRQRQPRPAGDADQSLRDGHVGARDRRDQADLSRGRSACAPMPPRLAATSRRDEMYTVSTCVPPNLDQSQGVTSSGSATATGPAARAPSISCPVQLQTVRAAEPGRDRVRSARRDARDARRPHRHARRRRQLDCGIRSRGDFQQVHAGRGLDRGATATSLSRRPSAVGLSPRAGRGAERPFTGAD